MTYTFNNENLFGGTASYELLNRRSASSDFSGLSGWRKLEQTCNLEQDQFAAICTKAGRRHERISSFLAKLERRLEDLKWNLSFQKTSAAFENKKA